MAYRRPGSRAAAGSNHLHEISVTPRWQGEGGEPRSQLSVCFKLVFWASTHWLASSYTGDDLHKKLNPFRQRKY